jgi:MFS family permease
MTRLPRTVIALGVVSLCTDFSSEMIYPLLPLFLSSVLGAGAVALGVIEGVAEAAASLLKVASGLWTDRTGRRRPWMLGGYGLAGVVRPLIGLAAVWPAVLALRFIDRVGKGLRTSPRDAMIADVTEPNQRGRAYGFHRAMDHLGAVVGPLAAAGLMAVGLGLRPIFLLAAIPALAAFLVIILAVREPGRTNQKSEDGRPATSDYRLQASSFSRQYKLFLLAVLLFTLGNSTDAFLLLSLSKAGVPAVWVAGLWSAHHLVKMMATYSGGRLADRLGFRWMIVSGWGVYAVIYAAFALVPTTGGLIAVFLAYGLYFGLTEPAEKALVSLMVTPALRGTAFGYYHGIIGLGALPASALFGLIWSQWGAAAAFLTGAGLALAAALALLGINPRPCEPERPGAAPAT